MAKKKEARLFVGSEEVKPGDIVKVTEVKSPVTTADVKPHWSFPSPVRCRRCLSSETKVYGKSRDGRTQYRACQVPECGHRFPVHGTRI